MKRIGICISIGALLTAGALVMVAVLVPSSAQCTSCGVPFTPITLVETRVDGAPVEEPLPEALIGLQRTEWYRTTLWLLPGEGFAFTDVRVLQCLRETPEADCTARSHYRMKAGNTR